MLNAILNAENLAQKGKLEESQAAFMEILAAEPSNVRSLLGLGIVCFKQGDNDGAEAQFKKILESKSNHLEALKNLCMVYATKKDKVLALETLERLLGIRKNDPEFLAFGARIYHAFEEQIKAKESIEKALELSSTNYIKQAEFNDIKAHLNGLPLPSKIKKKLNLTVCCVPGMDSFIHDSLKRLSLYLNVTTSISLKAEDHIKNLLNAQIVWLEWGNQLTQFILTQTNILSGKKVIVRIHSYELYDGLAEKINYDLAGDIVFVSPYMRDLFIQKNFPTAKNCRLNVIHNGIDLSRFSYLPRSQEKNNIAFLAYISYKKDPMVMMQAFSYLAKDNPDLKLHVAGMYQDSRYALAMPHFAKKAGLNERIVFYGHVNNPDEWFKDKDYILCSSLNESQGLGILEAMSRGLKPLVYNFPGAEDIYLPGYLWTTFDQLKELYDNPPDPQEVSAFVSKYYSKEREIGSWLKLLLDNQQVDEIFDFAPEKPAS
ncbi:MAG: glycosyltransferase [Deltaproteobacteria bacterium]|jgi:glycosyltransferase involved in cell wall biosynthesis|nr:glycosyltransferase [Deltaproteobacteria bacterium]